MLKKIIVFMALALTLGFVTSCDEDSSTEPAWYPIIRGTIVAEDGTELSKNVTRNIKVEKLQSGVSQILTITGIGGDDDEIEWKVEFKLDADNPFREYSTANGITDGVSIYYTSPDDNPDYIGSYFVNYEDYAAYGGETKITLLDTYVEGEKLEIFFEGEIFKTGDYDTKLELKNGLVRASEFLD